MKNPNNRTVLQTVETRLIWEPSTLVRYVIMVANGPNLFKSLECSFNFQRSNISVVSCLILASSAAVWAHFLMSHLVPTFLCNALLQVGILCSVSTFLPSSTFSIQHNLYYLKASFLYCWLTGQQDTKHFKGSISCGWSMILLKRCESSRFLSRSFSFLCLLSVTVVTDSPGHEDAVMWLCTETLPHSEQS